MANNQILKDAIAAVIKTNGNNEITGQLLQNSLISIINHFGNGAIFAGVAEPSTVPINNDVVAFYIATTNGIYPNFGGYSLTNNDFVIFSNKEGAYEAVAELNVSGINYLAPIEPGTIADRAELPTMKPNQKYTFEAKPGYYKFGSSVYDLTTDKRWLFFGDGSVWSLEDMGELPGVELNTEVQPNDTTKAPSGKAVTDYVEGKFKEVKTDNLLDLNEVETGKKISFGGVVQNGTGVISGYIPVEAGKTYRIIGRRGAYDTAFYGLYDENKGNISGQQASVQTITVPELSNIRFIRYHLPKDLDFEGCMFVEGDRFIPYIPNSLPKNTNAFLTKKDAVPFEDLNPNQNLYFGSFKKEAELYNISYRNDAFALVNEEDEILKAYGIEKSLVHFNNAFNAAIGFSSNFAETDKIKYLTMTVILSTDDEGWEDITSENYIVVNGVALSGTGIYQSISKSYKEIATGVYLVTLVCSLPEMPIFSVYARMNFGMKSSNENISKYSGFSFALTEELPQSPLLKPFLLKDKVRKHLNDSIIYWNDSGSRYIDKGMKNKKVCLYGTSVEAGGYFDKVAEVYEFDYHNFGNGGGGITWSNENSWWGDNVVNVQKSWSATIAEKQAYCLANDIAFGQQEIDDCYETNLLGNLDADLFIIGTYGINDSGRTGLEIDKENRKYDRSTIYGAYCYVLRKLFEAKPTARVILFGMHSFAWTNNYAVNAIIAEVAKDWNLPFLDWGRDLGFSNEIVNGSEGETTVAKNAYAFDGIHVNAEGRRIMAEYLIRQLRNYV